MSTLMAVVYGVLAIPGVLGNVLTIVVLLSTKEFRDRPVMVLMASLAASDLSSFSMFAYIELVLSPVDTFSTDKSVHLVALVSLSFWTVNLYHMVAIGVNRYVTICHYKSKVHLFLTQSLKPTILTILFGWLGISVLFCL